ncbi:MAG: flippase-like domain-containing protein [Thermoplasmata archaeon]|nr:MAG: flippase-like domain-containing protein [Thermoplasmata archaeon]
MERKRATNLAINALMFVIGIVIIALMLYFIGAENVIEVMLKADPYLLTLSILLMLSILSIKLVRWWLLQKEANFTNSSRVYLIGQAMNLFAPIGTGEITRAAIAKTKLGIKARDTMAAVVIERISDITFLVAMAGICIILFIPGQENLIFIIILIAILAIAYFLLFKPQFFDRLAVFIEKLFEKRGKFLTRLSLKISISISKFKGAIIKFHKRKALLAVNAVLTVLGWVIEAVVTYTLLLAFDVASPPFIFYLLVVNATSWVARTFLFLPVGPKEVTFILLLENLFGIAGDIGSAVALTLLAINYIGLGIGAVVSIFTFPPRPKVKEEEKESPEDDEDRENKGNKEPKETEI